MLVMSRVQIVQPPRIATWLVGLFIVEEQACMQEQILEKFSDTASRRGMGPARRLYWKWSAKTIARLIGGGFRTAPWLIIGTALAGGWVVEFTTSRLQPTITGILLVLNHHVRPYLRCQGCSHLFLLAQDCCLSGKSA